jgi:hypothetical protein
VVPLFVDETLLLQLELLLEIALFFDGFAEVGVELVVLLLHEQFEGVLLFLFIFGQFDEF